MKLLKSIVLFTLVFISSTSLFAQHIVTGVVSDATGPLPGVIVEVKGENEHAYTDFDGNYQIKVKSPKAILVFNFLGYKTKKVKIKNRSTINVLLEEDETQLEELVVVSYKSPLKGLFKRKSVVSYDCNCPAVISVSDSDIETNESYAAISENDFLKVYKSPLSTFSVDVDVASYSNTRRYINSGSLPPVDAVRTEEMINYFKYDYPQPTNEVPFSMTSELSVCPWNTDNQLLHIGIQGKKIAMENLPASNIVFLLDVSGSMSYENKLPLLKSSLKLLLNTLRPIDKVAIVVYAGNSGVVLPSTSCDKKEEILVALDKLNAGGSTAGGEGIQLAYKIAQENFISKGNNRIVLATDGDFNVGVDNTKELQKLIEKKRESGIAISVLGFGMGNYKDDMMETIADKGNGNYAYIDNLLEAKKTLVSEFGGTFFTIAKDVKLQIEFNPLFVSKYRLIGYENRKLNDEDFDDDKKDAGEIGAGHSVTAIYELILTNDQKKNQNLKYQKSSPTEKALTSNDLATLKIRYKEPKGKKSKLIEHVIDNTSLIALDQTSDNYRFSAAVAEYAMLLRKSKFLGSTTWDSAYELAKGAKSKDEEGYRGEFVRLIETAKLLE